MKHTTEYIQGLEELITDRLLPVYYSYYREKGLTIPKPDINKELTALMRNNKCKLPRLFLPKEIHS